MKKSFFLFLSFLSPLLLIAGCGGGGGGGVVVAPPPPPPTGWQQGVFLDASTFRNRCEAPRSGTDPATGQPYPDIAGSILDENNFLRSFTNDTYLWYDEITDQDPANFNDPEVYFEQLKTFAVLPSGAPKDSFSFSYDSAEWFQLSQGGVSAGYGARWAVISATPPREIVVAYTEPNSPATAVSLARGATILAIDGVDINVGTQAGVDTLNAGLFPSTLGEPHTFTILDLGAQSPRDITMTSTSVTSAMVQETQVFDTPTGKVGYLVFNYFRAPAEEALIDAINQLINDAAPDPVDDLILDLRYNGGGFGVIARQLGFMIAGPSNTAGRIADVFEFNDKHPATNPITGEPLSPSPFPSTTSGFFTLPAGQPLPTLNLSRVFVLTGPNTCSASELVMNSLRGIDIEVIQVGSTTCGKPYGFYEEPNCGTSYFPVQFRTVNEKGFGDYAEGFQPSNVDDGLANVLGCPVLDDYTKLLGDPGENRLEVALAYQAGQTCIAPAAAGPGSLSKPGLRLDAVDGRVFRSPFDSNLIVQP
ncbi:MAG: S41 family peptidase [Gammaproteobacteria bacterium]|nr:S41 family peptidase [Gammaproteobacteria bacterium]MDH3363146.1 S41 family peptidase [Gammaproteobacteria bacterium]MDH3481719.1 S41 family peptidase [Gammaproteobacteria bacterium]